MIRVIVSGACGKMGLRIIESVLSQPGIEITGALERKDCPGFGKDIGEILHIRPAGVVVSGDINAVIKNCDVLVEFSSPEASIKNLRVASANRKPAVIGTTGFSASRIKEIKSLSRKIPCVLSPNMSVGVNILLKIIRRVAPALKDYDIEIVEMHHNQKKDAPSGTAVRLAEVIAETLGIDLGRNGIYGRKGLTGARKKKEICIHSVRGGDVVGDHTVIFAGRGERIELVHRASSRDAFASGAVKAARFVASAKPGLYSMEDVLEKNNRS